MKWMRRSYGFVKLLVWFIYELLLSNLRLLLDILTPQHQMQPGVMALHLDVESRFGRLLLSNLISLTPGTLSLDLSSDHHTLYVHVMYLDDESAYRKNFQGTLVKLVKELTE